MPHFSLLEDDDEPSQDGLKAKHDYNQKEMDSLVEGFRETGIVNSDKLLEEQQIKSPGITKTEVIGHFEVSYGPVFNDYNITICPLKNSFSVSKRMSEHRNFVIMAMVKTLSPLIPQDLTVNLNEPAADWDIQLWGVVMKDAMSHLNFDSNYLEEHMVALVENLTKASLGKNVEDTI